MKTCIKCGSHAFNLYAEGIDQGGFCDVHYWKDRTYRALAQPDYRAVKTYHGGSPVYVSLPVQELVAWAIYDKRGGSKSLHWPENHSPDGDATKFDAVPLCAAPSKRPWVGLTDDDMPSKELDAFCRGARWADDKLKEKNT